MEQKDAHELRIKWLKLGNKTCNHPDIVKEFWVGSPTGDYVCTQCGEIGNGKNWNTKDD